MVEVPFAGENIMSSSSVAQLTDDYAHRPVRERLEVCTHKGITIRVEVEEAFHDRCWRLQNFWAYHRGKTVGCLRTMEVDLEAFEELYPTVWDYLRERMGHTGVEGRKDLQRWGHPEALARQARKRMKHDRSLAHRPWVAMVRVGSHDPEEGWQVSQEEGQDQGWRRQGIGTALYLAASLYQRRRGQSLWSLDHPSESARGVWKNLLAGEFSELVEAQEQPSPLPGHDEDKTIRRLAARKEIDWDQPLDLQTRTVSRSRRR